MYDPGPDLRRNDLGGMLTGNFVSLPFSLDAHGPSPSSPRPTSLRHCQWPWEEHPPSSPSLRVPYFITFATGPSSGRRKILPLRSYGDIGINLSFQLHVNNHIRNTVLQSREEFIARVEPFISKSPISRPQ